MFIYKVVHRSRLDDGYLSNPVYMNYFSSKAKAMGEVLQALRTNKATEISAKFAEKGKCLNEWDWLENLESHTQRIHEVKYNTITTNGKTFSAWMGVYKVHVK